LDSIARSLSKVVFFGVGGISIVRVQETLEIAESYGVARLHIDPTSSLPLRLCSALCFPSVGVRIDDLSIEYVRRADDVAPESGSSINML
jgi:hypothetical protein